VHRAEKIERILDDMRAMAPSALIVVQNVEIIQSKA
jgi:hypothetical protein